MQSNEDLVKDSQPSIPFTLYDAGWVLLCIGMAIGSGIVFMPIQIGIKGLWVFLISGIVAYPAVYIMQDLYLKTLAESDNSDDYVNIIAHYLGKNWAAVLGVAYFLMLLNGMFSYSLTITNDSASYLHTFGLAPAGLANTIWYGLVLMIVMVAIAAQGERLLFKIATPMVLFKLGIIIVLGVVMIPFWDFKNLKELPAFGPFIRDFILTLPFALFSILFVQIINPMNIAYRRIESDKRIALYRAVRANRVACMILIVSVLFFAISCSLTLSYENALSAKEQNISALALAAAVIPGDIVKWATLCLNIFAVLTAFFGIYLGFYESIRGIVLNLIDRVYSVERLNQKIFGIAIHVAVIIGLWAWITIQFPVIMVTQLAAPLFGVVTCLIPCYLIIKVPALAKLKGPSMWFMIFFGVILCIVPFMYLFE